MACERLSTALSDRNRGSMRTLRAACERFHKRPTFRVRPARLFLTKNRPGTSGFGQQNCGTAHELGWAKLATGCMAERESIGMAKILVNIEKRVEFGAEVVLSLLTGAGSSLRAAPAVIAALAILVDAVDKPLMDLAGAASNPLNIPLDIQTAADLAAPWPQVKTFLGSLGEKF